MKPIQFRTFPRAACLWVAFGALVAWTLFLRWPSLDVTLWNVDEAIHAAAAQTLLDGGVLYRDAVDQRTPISYYAYAAIFAVAGINNLVAVRIVLALMIAATAFGILRLGTRMSGRATGWWAALLFCAFSTNLFEPGDLLAAHTEWFVIAFTVLGAAAFWRAIDSGKPGPACAAGILFACASLSKQPALLDFAAPLLTTGYLVLSRQMSPAAGSRLAATLVASFVGTLTATILYFWTRGALRDFYFYAWDYNLNFYGPEIGVLDRVLSAGTIFTRLATVYPIPFVAGLIAGLWFLIALVQRRTTPEERVANQWGVFLLVWSGAALAGAAAGGRGFGHYFIQCLPPFALIAGWALGRLTRFLQNRMHAQSATSLIRRGGFLAFVPIILAAGSISFTPIVGRSPDRPPPDPALRVSEFIQSYTEPDDSIFVWGYNPDIYLYANRRPASRFVYSSFMTGLVPWTNVTPGVDTSYAIVPGTMETLLADLETRRPVFIVDCSPGPHRRFSKYPLSLFKPLEDFIFDHYVEVEPGRFNRQGFGLYLIRDASRNDEIALTGEPSVEPPPAPALFGPSQFGSDSTRYIVEGSHPEGHLQRLEILINGSSGVSASFPPSHGIGLRFRVPLDRIPGDEQVLVARATAADGKTSESAPIIAVRAPISIPASELTQFRLPRIADAIHPIAVRAPFGASVSTENGRREYSLHAPSVLIYAIDGPIDSVRGSFGIREGAYAPDNPAPTDGAEFRIEWISPNGQHHVVFRRHLQPRENHEDRSVQSFAAHFPEEARGGRLEFHIHPGPFDDATSDWTFWSDLVIESPGNHSIFP